MGELISLVFFFWIPQAVIQILNWTYWIQAKEYRFDRFRLLFGSKDGIKNLELGIYILTILIFLIISIFKLPALALLIPIIYLDFKAIFLLKAKSLRRPVFTSRAVIIVLFAFSLSFLTIIAGMQIGWSLSYVLIIAELFLSIGTFLGTIITLPLVKFSKRQAIFKASEILKRVNPMVIGVTGSYGKSSTKEFIAQLLSQKYKVVKTEGSENTELGLARRVEASVNNDTEYFVAEMGAYKKGEISSLCKIVKPVVGVVTGIEPQHLALFGDKSEIIKAKFELIESLPLGGYAFFNLNNKYSRNLYLRAIKLRKGFKVKGYSVGNIPGFKSDIQATLLKYNSVGIDFEVKEENFRKKLFSPLNGVHFIENLAGAILLARTFGVSWDDIQTGCLNIVLPSKTMEVIKVKSGGVIIDDSFNTTPKGFSSAILYLSDLVGIRKVIITSGIIELGNASGNIHKQIARELTNTADELILIGADFEPVFKQNIRGKTRLRVIKKRSSLPNIINRELKAGSTVLLEGRMPGGVDKLVARYKSIK